MPERIESTERGSNEGHVFPLIVIRHVIRQTKRKALIQKRFHPLPDPDLRYSP